MSTVLSFDGHPPRIDPDAWVAPTATALGDATLAAGASVFYGAVIGTAALVARHRTVGG